MNTPKIDREIALAQGRLDADDRAVLNAVRAYFDESDPVPPGLIDRIQFELTLDALHAEVATLITMDPELAGVRSASTEAVRTVTFTSESLTTMVTITPQLDGTVRVDGWVTPIGGVRIEVHLATQTHTTVADEDGRFVFEGLPSGMAKFAWLLPEHDGSGSEATTVLSPTIEL